MTMQTGSPTAGGNATATNAATTTAHARVVPWLDYLTVGAIGMVVVLISIPRLRAFALRENELDAMRMLRALAAQPAPAGVEVGERNLARLVAQDTGLKRRLEDLEFLDGGRLRRHGYVFDMTMLRPGEPMLRAWPWNHGQTGRGAFVWTPQRGLIGAMNSDGRFSGADGAPEPEDIDDSWLSVRHTR